MGRLKCCAKPMYSGNGTQVGSFTNYRHQSRVPCGRAAVRIDSLDNTCCAASCQGVLARAQACLRGWNSCAAERDAWRPLLARGLSILA